MRVRGEDTSGRLPYSEFCITWSKGNHLEEPDYTWMSSFQLNTSFHSKECLGATEQS